MASAGQIGRRLLELMNERGVSQVALADRLNTSQSTVSAWVNGKAAPSFTTALAIADVLGVPISSLAAPPSSDAKTRIGRPPKSSLLVAR